MAVKPNVFIVGCPRSGTTLLQRMIDVHPEIAITPSMHWITGYFRKQGIWRPEDLVGLESVSDMLEKPASGTRRCRYLASMNHNSRPLPKLRHIGWVT